jgi:hypothetical protein
MSARVLGASPKVVGIPKDPTNCVGVVSTFIPVQNHRRTELVQVKPNLMTQQNSGEWQDGAAVS